MSGTDVAVTGSIARLDAAQRSRLFDRAGADAADVQQTVREIIADVRTRGDEALREQALQFDGVALDDLEVPPALWKEALARIAPDVRSALEEAAASIRAFHTAQMPTDFEMETRPGVRLGRRAEPLDSVGIYAPGGRAAYPSSVLMGVIPARVAGVPSVIVCSPAGPGGLPSDVVLAACAIADASRVFAIGGAGAIGALAIGTQSVPTVARIMGPGNAWVTEAKRQVNGIVAIDSPAGPSEVLVIADATADADLVAMELLAQAEHDPDAAVVAVVIDAPQLIDEVMNALARITPSQPRADIIRASLAARGAVLAAASLEEALAFAAEYAPEHLSLMVADPRAALRDVRRAGTVFLGSSSSVAFGDYMTGANHVLPTNRLARSYSGLSALDFIRFTTYQEVSATAAAAMSAPTAVLAAAEGLPAHGLAAAARAGRGTVSAAPSDRAPIPARSSYRDIDLYEPGRMPCAVDLSDNTNLHGVPPAARAALTTPAAPLVTRYPTVYARELKRAIAEMIDVDPARIVTGCGSDDILDSMMRAFCDAGDRVVYPDPTFGVVDLFARMNSASPRAVAHTPEGQLDVDALAAADGTLTYICRPNNPTGTLYTRASVEALEQRVSGVLAIDEAYADYAEDNLLDLAASSDRTVIVRTLSKAFGLAGLRIGYATGPVDLIREIEKSRGPYKVGGLAEAAAIAAITHDRAWITSHADQIRDERERLAQRLREAGLAPLSSSANFLLIPVPAPDTAAAWGKSLREQGVAIRAFEGLPQIGDAIRVTIGPRPLMERFMNALDVVRASTAAGAERKP